MLVRLEPVNVGRLSWGLDVTLRLVLKGLGGLPVATGLVVREPGELPG